MSLSLFDPWVIQPRGTGRYSRSANLWDDLFGPLTELSARGGGLATWPAVDVHTTDTEVQIKADLPGLRKEDIRVEVVNGGITISGSRTTESESAEEQGRWMRRERSVGSFSRTIPVEGVASAEQVQASFQDGVLHVTAPRTDKSRSVTIQ